MSTTHNAVQGSGDWLDARRGILTASAIGKLITTKTLKLASNDYSRGLMLELVTERITGRTESIYVSQAMERGNLDEPIARDLYGEHIASVTEAGFITEKFLGNTLGYSPDGLVGDVGLIEIKSRSPKVQMATILNDNVPIENMAQLQAGMLVTGRPWCDYVSYCAGMPLYIKRVYQDEDWQNVLLEALRVFEETAAQMIDTYQQRTAGMPTTTYHNHFATDDIEIS